MITLVTQFDDPATVPSGATPSGGSSSSSCCCCCVVTAVGASTISGLHVRSIRRLEAEAPSDTLPSTRRFLSRGPDILGFLALAIAVGVFALGTWIDASVAGYLAVACVLLWGVLLYLAYRGARDERSVLHAMLTVGLASVAAVFEFFVWLAAVE